jgi:hypothetical protein
MKEYVFGYYNWKEYGPTKYFKKQFRSAYYADRYAMRISFQAKNSPYMVFLIPGEEEKTA